MRKSIAFCFKIMNWSANYIHVSKILLHYKSNKAKLIKFIHGSSLLWAFMAYSRSQTEILSESLKKM